MSGLQAFLPAAPEQTEGTPVVVVHGGRDATVMIHVNGLGMLALTGPIDELHDLMRHVAHALGRSALEPETPSINCPRCWCTSWNPNDVREGYCGGCHDWTSADWRLRAQALEAEGQQP